MNKSELKNLINEAISEAMTESAPPKFPRALEKKLLAQYKDNPAKAYATMWTIHNKKNEGDQRISEMWMAYEEKGKNEDYDPDAEERMKYNDKINSYNKKDKSRHECPTCNTPDALSSWEKKKGYQCSACADREEGLYESTEEAPLYVEYVSQMRDEEPFMMGGQKFEFVNAKYPNGKKDIGVYAFSGDVVYAYDAFRKMYNIKENHDEADMSNPEEKKEVGIAKKMKKHIDAFLKMHGQLDEVGGETDMSDPAEKKEVDHATEIKKLSAELLKMHGK